MKEIREYFNKLVPLTATESDHFTSKLIRREFKKNELILCCGKTEQYLSFVEKGMVRFYSDKGEKEITFSFTFENSFVSAYDSFLMQNPVGYYVQALADTVLWSISHTDLQKVYRESADGQQIGRRAAEELFIKKSKREMSFLRQSAQERYENLFAENPVLLQKIPLKYIASYIGVTPQALSRIRRRIYS
ncbi:Crp/Fnr family transcriptional regulator [Sinomicrobium weinanense]|uniref:Crp/Fnr family transcriptional regulator n=1 Tax=Sinomicrobium weinanense TaxID=2842200 RepID=A0A926Q3F7_9FLAO|nr:Crp/Fnr family transcriptional regulator [Sinomicrobium weinanense]MBC9795956.1 Crp/Fnr family transcriptional regulator [Sinomicrobium weinanense]MBU3122075.1 Crp/Fnr family transcriptional regulator [Sinomicrobium weinanense]